MIDPVEQDDPQPADDVEVEVVDAVPVPQGAPMATDDLAAAGPVRSSALASAGPVAVQAAAVAMTGFAAGAATVAVVRRRRTRKAARARRKDRRALGDVRASRSFLVDIHLLGGRD